MDTYLDKLEKLRELDKGSMLKALREFPESCRRAVETAEGAYLGDLTKRAFRAIVFAGMGGSAIGGLILRDWLLHDCVVPIHVSRGHYLPAFVDEETLVFAVSYSGNTAETLSAFREAQERGCAVVSLTSDGELQRLANEEGLPFLSLPPGLQPRASLPDQFFSLATIMKRLDIVSDQWREVDEAFEVLKELRDALAPNIPTVKNRAKQLAHSLRGTVPLVYGPRLFQSVAYRISTQLNENSKVPAGSGFFPEAFHNAVMGLEGPEELRRHICVLFIRDSGETPEMRRKVDAFRELSERSFGRVLEIRAVGDGRLARMFSALYIGGYTSVYLGLLYGKDPSSVDTIDALKKV
jgi:glucose/mannose-6-phosphate isomerase